MTSAQPKRIKSCIQDSRCSPSPAQIFKLDCAIGLAQSRSGRRIELRDRSSGRLAKAEAMQPANLGPIKPAVQASPAAAPAAGTWLGWDQSRPPALTMPERFDCVARAF
jgi:hypothetical protein